MEPLFTRSSKVLRKHKKRGIFNGGLWLENEEESWGALDECLTTPFMGWKIRGRCLKNWFTALCGYPLLCATFGENCAAIFRDLRKRLLRDEFFNMARKSKLPTAKHALRRIDIQLNKRPTFNLDFLALSLQRQRMDLFTSFQRLGFLIGSFVVLQRNVTLDRRSSRKVMKKPK